MNIPRFLELFQEGRLEDAFESVIMGIIRCRPLSTGRICYILRKSLSPRVL